MLKGEEYEQLEPGTRVRVLFDIASVEVGNLPENRNVRIEVLDGRHIGRTGEVARNQLRPQ